MEIFERIAKISRFCSEIVKKTGELMRLIKNLCRSKGSKLNDLKWGYMSILEKGMMKDLKELVVKDAGVPDVESFKKFYESKFYEEKIVGIKN